MCKYQEKFDETLDKLINFDMSSTRNLVEVISIEVDRNQLNTMKETCGDYVNICMSSEFSRIYDKYC